MPVRLRSLVDDLPHCNILPHHYRTQELCQGPTALPRVKYRTLGKGSFAESQRSANLGSRQSQLCRELDSPYKQDLCKASALQTVHIRRHLCREPAVRLSSKYFSLLRALAKALRKKKIRFLLLIFLWSLATVLEAKI
jgi:hypothetical protein